MENFFSPPIILGLLGVFFLVLEIFVTGFVTLPAGTAFCMAALLAPLASNSLEIVFISLLSLVANYLAFWKFVWPRMDHHRVHTAADGMIGKVAVAIDDLGPHKEAAYIKLYGDTWRAQAQEAIPAGSKVVITKLEGNQVHVERIDP
ncbi:MAG: NfeD family protein [Polyangiaceae bacterium]|nr:NfeD family protein [Polyangiaceae bacterium]